MINRKKILTASLWVLIIFGLSQVVRLGSNLIVTRMLEPEMFGLMAVVYVILHGLGMFSDLGLWSFVVRNKNGTDPHFLNVIWSMQVVRGWIMFSALFLGVIIFVGVKEIFNPNLRGIYANDLFPVIIIIVGVAAIVNGYINMAPALISREIKRGKLESIDLTAQVLSSCVMITWAYINPSIWALVAAGVLNPVFGLFLTRIVFPLKHKFTWDKKIVKEAYDFGKWIVLASILTYISQQGDRLYFGAYINPALLGAYSIGFMLYQAVVNVTEQISFKIWFPTLSNIVNNDHQALKRVYYSIRQKQDILLFAVTGMLFASAQTIIDFLYDDRYSAAGWALQTLSLSLIGETMSIVGLECLSALGITKYRVKVMLYRSLGIMVGLPLCFYLFSYEGAVYCVAFNVFLGIPVIYKQLYKVKILSLFHEIRMLPIIFISYWAAVPILALFK